jgi:hypothetical protein
MDSPGTLGAAEQAPRRQTRSNASATTALAGENPALWPVDGSGNFVEMTLKVVVKSASASLMAFDPTFCNGSTRLCGAHGHAVTLAFSQRIYNGYLQAKEGPSIILDSGVEAAA